MLIIHENEIKNKAVTDSRNMLLAVLNAIPVRVFWKDINGDLLGCNDLFMRDAGLDGTTDITTLSCDDMPWHAHADDFELSTRQAYESMSFIKNVEQTIPVASGESIIVSMSSVPLLGSDGDIIGVLTAYDDITMRKRIENELVEARELAEEANLAKSDFLSSMSHELRTPMNAVLGFAQLLQANLDGNLSSRELVEVGEIIKGGTHLLGLINQVLDLARIESGKIEISMESVNLMDLMNECQSMIKPLADKRNIGLEINIDSIKEIELYADYMRLKQVMLNLLSNAVKYNHEHGSINVTYSVKPNDHLRINVCDTGPGLDEMQIRKLFQRFQRLDAEFSAVEGTGIGLVLSKNLIELMNGQIGVESEVSVGSTFWIELDLFPGWGNSQVPETNKV